MEKLLMNNNPKIIIKYMQGYKEEDFNLIYGMDLDSYIKSTYNEYISRDFKYYVLKEN